MKRCPYCDEEVRDNAIKCKHCGSMLRGQGTDNLDAAVTIGSEQPSQQYDTLDAAATQGKEATVLARQYRIIKKIGEGGMGVVYLAEDIELGNRKVAIKVLPPLLSRNIRAVENLRKEALTAIKLNHPNIIRLHGFHSDGDIRFLVMEYIDGQTLEEKVIYSERGRMSLEEILPVAQQIAAALDYAHSQIPPVFHRDLKPSNVMIDKSGRVKLLDFGIAREMKDSYTRVTGQETSGTVPYMCPQQINGDPPDAQMDIYSFAVTLYECMAAHPPFYTGDIKHQILNKRPPEIADVPEHVNKALQAALAKKASDRPAPVKDLIRLLEQPRVAVGKVDEMLPETQAPPAAPDSKVVVEKIRKWIENRKAEWSEGEWKDFVISLYDDGCAVGMSHKKLETVRDREKKAWIKTEEARKAEEARIAEERRRAAEEAERKRKEAEEARRRWQEEQLFEEIKTAPTIQLCERYRTEFPKGRYVRKVEKTIENLRNERKDQFNLIKIITILALVVAVAGYISITALKKQHSPTKDSSTEDTKPSSQTSRSSPITDGTDDVKDTEIELVDNTMTDITIDESTIDTTVPTNNWTVQPFVNSQANEKQPVWSPNGMQMAYLSDESGTWEAYIINSNGTGKLQLSNGPGKETWFVTWSPDSQYLLYSKGNGRPNNLFKVLLNKSRDGIAGLWNLTQVPVRTVNLGWGPAQFSPDGSQIVSVRSYNGWPRLQIMPNRDADAQESNWMPIGKNYGMSVNPSWSPDGSLIAYAYYANYQLSNHSDICTILPDGTNDTIVVDKSRTLQHTQTVAWNQSGSNLAFAEGLWSQTSKPMGSVSTGGINIDWLDQGPAGLPPQYYAWQTDIWSPDGNSILYSYKENGNWNIYLIDKDGSNKRLVASSQGIDVLARFSVDGKIVFQTNRDGNWDIYVATPAGPGSTYIFSDDFEYVTIGDYPSGSGWQNLFSGKSAYVSNKKDHTGSKSLCFESLPTWSRTDYISLSELPDRLSYKVSVYPDTRGESRSVRVGFPEVFGNQGPFYNCFSINVTNGSIGTVSFTAGLPGSSSVDVGEFAVGEWVTLRADLDFRSSVADLWLGGRLAVTDAPITPKEFAHTGLGHVTLSKFGATEYNWRGGGTGVFYIDDVRIWANNASPSNPKAGDNITNSIGMKLVYIPAGEFMMGGSRSAAELAREYGGIEEYYTDELPQHRVRISKGIWMGQCEVTQSHYRAVMGAGPWSGQTNVQKSDNNPAVYASWDEALEFCKKLSQTEGRIYRLPTEAEWEYACRAGTTTIYSFGDNETSLGEYAWFSGNAFDVGAKYAHPVGQKKPNAFGLYDMHGNVWEWCSDWYYKGYYAKSSSVDPKGPSNGEYGVLRGGSYRDPPRICYSALRRRISRGARTNHFGFRIVLELEK